MIELIDGNSLGHAAHNGTTLTHMGMQTQAIFGVVRMVRARKVSNPEFVPIFLWDGHARRRFELLPEYKSGREQRRNSDPEALASHQAYQKQVPVIQGLLRMLGVNQMVHPDYEADDLAGYLCQRNKGKRKRLTTGDSDWLQLVDQDTDWYDPRNDGILINHENFHQSTGYFTPDEYLEGKVLIGDSTDDIPGVDGIGKKTAAEFIAKWKSTGAFHAAVDAGTYTPAARKAKNAKSIHPEQFLASPEGRQLYERNMKLMDLRTVVIENPQATKVVPGKFEPEKARDLCDKLGFLSISRTYLDWVAPFRK